jgi:hypothetical protein
VAKGPATGGYGIYYWADGTWENVNGGGVHIAVGHAGLPAMVADSKKIYILNSDEVWQALPGRANDIAWGPGHQGSVFALGTNNSGRDGYGVWKWNWDTERWNQVRSGQDDDNAGGTKLAVDRLGNPWMVNDA